MHVCSDPLTPLRFIERSASVYADKVAVVYGERRYTYREYSQRVNRLASALLAKGLKKGDRVAFVCPNIPPMLEAHFAVLMAGGILVTINTRLSRQEIGYILGHSGARFVFVDTEFGDTVARCLNGLRQSGGRISIADDPQYPAMSGIGL